MFRNIESNMDGLPVNAVGSNTYLDMVQDSDSSLVFSESLSNADALAFCHPDWHKNAEKWEKFTCLYEAEDVYKYIFRHTRESDDIYNRRVARGYYYNYVASITDLFVAYLFHSPIERSLGNLSGFDVERLYQDANRAGDRYHIFIQMAATFAILNGHAGILVDAPKYPEDGISSEEDRKNKDFRPYLTLVQAHQIRDWELDEYGKFVWVKLAVPRPQERDWNEALDETSEHYLIWHRSFWQEWKLSGGDGDKQATLLGEGENPLGEVPLIIIRNERCIQHPWMGLSAVRDIADINIAILNWSSLGDEEIYERCLNVLVMEKGDDTHVSLSQYNVLEYEPGSNPPQYLTPGSSPLDLISKWIAHGKDEIYRLAKLGGSTGLLGVREATSGIAYAYEFNETNQSLAKKAESLEQAETEIHRLVAKWLGQEWDGKITYPREFGVEDFETELRVLSESRTNLSSDTAIQEIEKRMVSKLFARDSQELRDTITSEIMAKDPKMVGMETMLKTEKILAQQSPSDPKGAQDQNKGENGSSRPAGKSRD